MYIFSELSLMDKETWLDVYKAPVKAKYAVFINIFMLYLNLCFPLVKCRQSATPRNLEES